MAINLENLTLLPLDPGRASTSNIYNILVKQVKIEEEEVQKIILMQNSIIENQINENLICAINDDLIKDLIRNNIYYYTINSDILLKNAFYKYPSQSEKINIYNYFLTSKKIELQLQEYTDKYYPYRFYVDRNMFFSDGYNHIEIRRDLKMCTLI